MKVYGTKRDYYKRVMLEKASKHAPVEEVEIFSPGSLKGKEGLLVTWDTNTVIVGHDGDTFILWTPAGQYYMTKSGKLKKVKGKDA